VLSGRRATGSFRLAETDPSLHAIVIIAGPSRTGREVSDQQVRAALMARGLSGEQLESEIATNDRLRDVQVAANLWLSFWFAHDPIATAVRVSQPVLILQGATDTQVNPEQAEELAAGFRSGGNRDVGSCARAPRDHGCNARPSPAGKRGLVGRGSDGPACRVRAAGRLSRRHERNLAVAFQDSPLDLIQAQQTDFVHRRKDVVDGDALTIEMLCDQLSAADENRRLRLHDAGEAPASIGCRGSDEDEQKERGRPDDGIGHRIVLASERSRKELRYEQKRHELEGRHLRELPLSENAEARPHERVHEYHTKDRFHGSSGVRMRAAQGNTNV
jgi:hypothetical protein